MPYPPPGPERAPDACPVSALLAGLTPAQAEAVRHGPGPLLLIAGPGAGKTKTLIHRAAHLLATGEAAPRQVLAVTFSVRAASELRLRLADLLGERASRGVTAATFHAVSARLLREHAALFGRTDRYTIYDQAETRRVVDRLLTDSARPEIQEAASLVGQPAAAEVLAEISLAKGRLLDPGRYQRTARHPAARLVEAVWREAELELERCNAFDFDDLLVYAVRLLAEHPHRLAHVRRRWRWLLVDELQDTNHAQSELIALLVGPEGNLAAIGDDDQAVYGWRGADVGNILAFGRRFPGHRRIVLGRNFRCRAEVLDAAVACIEHNSERTPKRLLAVRGAGGRVEAAGFGDEHAEAAWTAGEIADALAAGTAPHDILVVARTGYATVPIQRALAAAGIPHRVLGSLGLYERAEVKDALAYLALLANPADAQAFRRAVQAPRRGIGAAAANRVVADARSRDGDLITACERAGALGAIRGMPARLALARFGAELDRIRDEQRAGRSLGHTVVAALTIDGGLVRDLQSSRDTAPRGDARRDADRALEGLRSLCRAAQTFEDGEATLHGFLEHAAGLHAHEVAPGEDRRITVSTIHRAKGTEAQLTALLACEERLLPSWRALESPDPQGLAEERRLFYVAVTRAKDRVVLTHAATRGGRPTGGPSRFLTEAGLIHPPAALAA